MIKDPIQIPKGNGQFTEDVKIRTLSFCFGASRQKPGAARHGRGGREAKKECNKRKQGSTNVDCSSNAFLGFSPPSCALPLSPS
ncbi:hypothetical protein TNCV_4862781 [Trichonephila clavipes]|nr:hypothetical protein TNCV_4862781 [Trichonephila clavipes]